jgi:hypothetical protein
MGNWQYGIVQGLQSADPGDESKDACAKPLPDPTEKASLTRVGVLYLLEKLHHGGPRCLGGSRFINRRLQGTKR